jgi:hypothetical protein
MEARPRNAIPKYEQSAGGDLLISEALRPSISVPRNPSFALTFCQPYHRLTSGLIDEKRHTPIVRPYCARGGQFYCRKLLFDFCINCPHFA